MTTTVFFTLFFAVFSASIFASDRDVWQRPNEVLEALELNANKDVFCEIGSGDGYFSLKMASRTKHVFAIDVDEKRLAALVKKIDKSAIKNITPVVATYGNPLLPSNTCDVIFMAMTYHHIENRIEYIKQLIPALRAGGRFVNIDNVDDVSKYKKSTKKVPAPSCRFKREDFLKETTAAGFKLIKSHTFLQTQYFDELVPR